MHTPFCDGFLLWVIMGMANLFFGFGYFWNLVFWYQALHTNPAEGKVSLSKNKIN